MLIIIFIKKNQNTLNENNIKTIMLIVMRVFIIIMNFASSYTCSKTTSKSTQKISNKHNLSLNNVRLHCPYCNTRNRLEITYDGEFVEFTDGAKILKMHVVIETNIIGFVRDTDTHGRRRHTMKISPDE